MKLEDYSGAISVKADSGCPIIVREREVFISDCDYAALARCIALLDEHFVDCLFARVMKLQNRVKGDE